MTSPNWSKPPPRRKAYKLVSLDLFTPWLVLGVLFYVLRQLEVWLHQHIFKVGWLVTKQYQTTTILYYAFFLPGIILNQVVFWLAAGFLNVSAERTIQWPQKQEIGELKLDFIRLSKNVSPFRFAVISTAPLLVGLFAVWQIATGILNVPAFLTELNTGGFLVNLSPALSRFTSAPDFWIWVYFAFTISNTMMPNFANLRGWRVVLIILAAIIAVLYVVGAGDQVVLNNIRGPITDALNSLSSVFAIIISLNLFMVAVLGTIEALIERITGDSATFENGKMMTLRRSERLAQRQKALAARPQPRSQRASSAPSGPPSVYRLHFPIPGAPGKEAVTVSPQIVITPEPKPALPSQPDSRSGPAVITAAVTEKLPPPAAPPIPANPVASMPKPAAGAAPFSQAAPSPASQKSEPLSTGSDAKPTGTSQPAPFRPPAASPAKPAAPTASTAPFGPPPSKPPAGSPTPAATFKPATPIGAAPTARNPVSSTMASPVKPAPKPVSPFASNQTDDGADQREDQDVDETEIEDEDDDDVSYEDYEDPA